MEDFAIKDGVQSTTRYRKGTGSKRFVGSEAPAPARQMSGRRGRNYASKNRVRDQQRLRDSYPNIQRPYPRVNTRRPPFNHTFEPEPQRNISPLTPRQDSTSGSPYFLPHVKREQDNISYEDIPIYNLGDIKGVYGDSPLFSYEA